MNVMKKAWEIAKDAVNKFGGKAVQYFAEALKEAWKILKNGVVEMELRVEEIKEGSEKQIKWAEDIRRTSLEILTTFKDTDVVKNYIENSFFNEKESLKYVQREIEGFVDYLHMLDDAAMIIEHGKFLTSKYMTIDEKIEQII